MENKQRPVIQETKELVQKYHVLEKAQLYAYFALDKRDHFVGKAFKALEKERLIYIHPKLEVVAANEEAFARPKAGCCDIMKQKTVEEHFLASKEEYRYGSCFMGVEKSMIFYMLQKRKSQSSITCFPEKKLMAAGIS